LVRRLEVDPASLERQITHVSTQLVSGTSPSQNRILEDDLAAHGWYRFVLSYPPHLVREYIERFGLRKGDTVLDPFCGTGTTLVECKKHFIGSIGVEAIPLSHFVSSVKLDWSPDPEELMLHAARVAKTAEANITRSLGFRTTALRTLPPESVSLLIKDSISPVPLHKSLILFDAILTHWKTDFSRHERLAFARALVSSIGNLHFGPEVGIGKIKEDAPVVDLWLAEIEKMANDLYTLRQLPRVDSNVFNTDARTMSEVLRTGSISAVITSPPYPNEKDYTRTVRLESVLLGFLRNRDDLKKLKRTLIRSNTRNVYKGDDDHNWVKQFPRITKIADEIEARRIELGKTSGFERLYSTVTKLYFGGMHRHLSDLRPYLKNGAQLAYVVGDQASYLQIMIRTGQILAEIAESLDYEVQSIDLFRTRHATVTREQLREEVVVLRWPANRTRK